MYRLKAGFVGFGEVNTPKEVIERKCREAAAELKKIGLDLLETPPVSDDPEGKDCSRAVGELKKEPFDLLVVCIAGWIPSHAVIKITAEFSHLPMLLWGLTGYFRDGRLVTTADQAGTTALRSVFERFNYKYAYVYSSIDSGHPLDKIRNFITAVTADVRLKRAKIGMMGYRDMNLYGTMFDGVSLRNVLGIEVEFFEMLEMTQSIEKIDPSERDTVIQNLLDSWTFEKEAPREALEKGVNLYLAVKKKILERNYEGVSLIDVDGVKKLMSFPPAMVFMLLGDDPGVCTIPENDSLGAVTQLITKYLTGQCAAYMEFYEFMQDRVLMGVPDFVPSEVVDGPVTATATAFGDFGEGVLNISKVKTGRVTLARVCPKGDGYALHCVTGEAVTPRSWEEEGWDPPAPHLPSLEIILDTPVEDFAERVLSQHYIISYGDNTPLFKTFCRLKGMEMY